MSNRDIPSKDESLLGNDILSCLDAHADEHPLLRQAAKAIREERATVQKLRQPSAFDQACPQDLARDFPAETAAEPKAGDSATVHPILGCPHIPQEGWTVDEVVHSTTYYLRHPNGSRVTVPRDQFTVKSSGEPT